MYRTHEACLAGRDRHQATLRVADMSNIHAAAQCGTLRPQIRNATAGRTCVSGGNCSSDSEEEPVRQGQAASCASPRRAACAAPAAAASSGSRSSGMGQLSLARQNCGGAGQVPGGPVVL